jgi:hypothetical protein
MGRTPLCNATMFGHRNMVSYLDSVTNFESLGRQEQISLLILTISADLYGMSL